MKTKFDSEAYVNRVTGILSSEFGWSETTVGICRSALANGVDPHLELICDHPSSARWRLKATGTPWGLRMGYYGESEAGFDRKLRINRMLSNALADADPEWP